MLYKFRIIIIIIIIIMHDSRSSTRTISSN